MDLSAECDVTSTYIEAWNAPCAMVPLKPNELSRDVRYVYVARGSTSTGIWNGLDATIDDRCTFSLEERISEIKRTRDRNVPA